MDRTEQENSIRISSEIIQSILIWNLSEIIFQKQLFYIFLQLRMNNTLIICLKPIVFYIHIHILILNNIAGILLVNGFQTQHNYFMVNLTWIQPTAKEICQFRPNPAICLIRVTSETLGKMHVNSQSFQYRLFWRAVDDSILNFLRAPSNYRYAIRRLFWRIK